jgi:gamma-tubulin complex component 2
LALHSHLSARNIALGTNRNNSDHPPKEEKEHPIIITESSWNDVQLRGKGLGQSIETMQIHLVQKQSPSKRMHDSNQQHETTTTTKKDIIHYGDRVVITVQPSLQQQQQQHEHTTTTSSSNAPSTNNNMPHWLMVRKTPPLPRSMEHPSGMVMDDHESFQVGFCSIAPNITHPKKNAAPAVTILAQWQIFPATTPEILVGNRAVQTNAATTTTEMNHCIPVRLYEPILLRNCATGGILSVQPLDKTPPSVEPQPRPSHFREEIKLLLSAIRQPFIAPSVDIENDDAKYPVSSDATSAMERLQRSHRLIPSLCEMFHCVPVHAPTLPSWIIPFQDTYGKLYHHCTFPHGENTVPEGPSGSTTTHATPWNTMEPSHLWWRKTNRYREGPNSDSSVESGIMWVPTSTEAARVMNPDWIEYLEHTYAKHIVRMPLGRELILIDELLGAFLGLEGRYLRERGVEEMADICHVWSFRFNIVSDADGFLLHKNGKSNNHGSTTDMVLVHAMKEMLPLANRYSRIRRFLGWHWPGFEYGSVMQAFCESIEQWLQKHYVEQVLEWQRKFRDDELSLLDLQILAASSFQAISVLEQACRVAQEKKGGALINALRKLKQNSHHGNVHTDQILDGLLCAMASPYLIRLSAWIEKGILLEDPMREFMVQKIDNSNQMSNDDTDIPWDKRYKIMSENVLEGFLANKLTVERVLSTGRYWNAVHSCQTSEQTSGKHIRESGQELTYATSTAEVTAYVHSMYYEASRSLVKLLLDENEFDLIRSLRIVKQFLLLGNGEFFLVFLDKAEIELMKDVSTLSRNRIQHWMNNVFRLLGSGESEESMSKAVPTGLRCNFSPESLTDHLDRLHSSNGGINAQEPWTPARHAYGGGDATEVLSGFDALVLEFSSIPFPISLVLSPSIMESYQLLFRHLFFAKHVERRLIAVWVDHQSMKGLESLRGIMGPTYLLRQRMLHFLQNLMYYMMFEVIQPNWMKIEKAVQSFSLTRERTVDDIIRSHHKCLQRILEACLLTNRNVIRALTKLLKTCLLFTEQMKRFMKATKLDDDRTNIAIETQKMVQRTLNERGASTSRPSTKILQENMRKAREENVQRLQRQTARIHREVSSESFQRMITRFEEVFSENMRDFMVQLTTSDGDLLQIHMVNLCIRLDYNGFVTGSLGLKE